VPSDGHMLTIVYSLLRFCAESVPRCIFRHVVPLWFASREGCPRGVALTVADLGTLLDDNRYRRVVRDVVGRRRTSEVDFDVDID